MCSRPQIGARAQVFALRLAPALDYAALPENIPLVVVYEDNDLIVVDKPVGMVVHPAPGTPSGTLVNALLHHCGDTLSGIGGEKRPGIVHRIDKDTSGLLVVAKTDRAHHALAAQFEAHTVNRHYLALIHGVPDAADPRLRGIKGVSFEPGGILKIATYLDRHRTDRQKQAVTVQGGRHAITRARVVEDMGAASLVECKPLRLVKVSRRRKHLLFDVTVAGPATIDVMRETGTTAMAVDAGRTLLLDREEMLQRANAERIAITGYPPAE